MKWHLLDSAEMRSLIESRNLEDAVALLKNTEYGKELSKLSSPTVAEIENVFSKSVLRDYKKIVMSVNGMPKTFLAYYTKKYEIDSLKLLLIMKGQGEEVKEHPLVMQRLMTMPAAEKLVEMETLEEVVEMLRFTKYYEVLHKAVSEYNETGTVYPFITALDTYQYSGLNKLLKNMGGKDRSIVEHLTGIEIDAKNLLTTLRIRDTDETDISKWLIPRRYRLNDSEITAAFDVSALAELQQILRHYTDIVSRGIKDYEKTRSLFTLEQEFERYILKENNRVFTGYRFHMGVPLAYLKLKENEVRNLTAILHGKEEGMDTSKIEEITILLNS